MKIRKGAHIMDNTYKLYIGFENFLKDKVLDGLITDGYEVLLSENNNFIISKITNNEYDKDNENYVARLIMSYIKKYRNIERPISIDISEKMNKWISLAKKDENSNYKVHENNYLHTLIRTTITSIILGNFK
ncbi:MAG: hypothetical protein IJ223_04865 [Clostridia bacterium]|nr:hypothetical protein [Clostridia bacterium]